MTPWTILSALPLTTGGYVCEARIPGVRAQFHEPGALKPKEKQGAGLSNS